MLWLSEARREHFYYISRFLCRGCQAWSKALGLGPSLVEVRGFESLPLHFFLCTYSFLGLIPRSLLRSERSERWELHSIFGIGKYTFKPYKIVWCCMSYKPDFSVVSIIKDNFIGNKKLIPDNTNRKYFFY